MGRSLELMCCTPGNGRQPTLYFLTKYCHTLGPSGQPEPIPSWRFVHTYADDFDSPDDVLNDKTRQMLLSWLGVGCMLHRVMFQEGFAGLLASQQANLIDDGGDHSTTDSLVGRMRYMYENLPEWMRDYSPLTFAHMRVTNPAKKSFIVGDSRKGNIGRGGTYDIALGDEWAYVEMSEASHRSLRPAAKKIVYQSTPNGRKNTFARIRHSTKTKFRRRSYPWWLHPERREGIYFDADGKPHSPWYDERTADLSDEQRGREYDIDYTTSLSGLVYKEFSANAVPYGHVKVASELRWDPTLPTCIAIDLGHARKTAAVVLQPAGRYLRVIGDFEGKHRGAGANAVDLIAALRALGCDKPLELVELIPDPSGRNDETGSGHSILSYYEDAGFKNWRFPMLAGPQSVRLGIALVREKFVRHEIIVSDACTIFLDKIQDYRYPTDRATEDIKSNNPVHDMASHIMDAFRYGVTALYTASGDSARDQFIPLEEQPESVAPTREDRDFVDMDDDSPIMRGNPLIPTSRGITTGRVV